MTHRPWLSFHRKRKESSPNRLICSSIILLFILCLDRTVYSQSSKHLLKTASERHLSVEEQTLPLVIQKLLIAYPDTLKTATSLNAHRGILHWRQNEESQWDIPRRQVDLDTWHTLNTKQRSEVWGNKPFEEVLNHPHFSDQFIQTYPKNRALPSALPINFEPGRIRDESFFKKLYGAHAQEVRTHLTTIRWGTQRLKVTRLYRINERLEAIYAELKKLPKSFRKFYEPSAGAYNWRTIKGTKRLSVHSFGAAIDIGVQFSNYWRWTLKVYGSSSKGLIPYKNRFPQEVISIFERYGFIWGGWWYHHDTMHFEYRPELLIDRLTHFNRE
jgi:peptidoglycan LD-endopeptidase CwlK